MKLSTPVISRSIGESVGILTQVTELSASQNVQMDMEHGLPTLFIAIHDQPVAWFIDMVFFCDLSCSQHHVTDQFPVAYTCIVDCVDMFTRDNQGMDWCLRTNISKRQHPVIFVDNVCGNVLVDNFTEKAMLAHVYSTQGLAAVFALEDISSTPLLIEQIGTEFSPFPPLIGHYVNTVDL